jgi:hypothetical protein
MRNFHRLASAAFGTLAAIAGLGLLAYGLTDLSFELQAKDEPMGHLFPAILFLTIALGAFVMSYRFLGFALKGRN